MDSCVVAYEILSLNRFPADWTDVNFRQWLVPPIRETLDQRLVIDARLYAFSNLPFGPLLFYEIGPYGPIGCIAPLTLEYPDKSHGILVLLLMSERGPYHKS